MTLCQAASHTGLHSDAGRSPGHGPESFAMDGPSEILRRLTLPLAVAAAGGAWYFRG